MSTILNGANKFSECPGANATLAAYIKANFTTGFDDSLNLIAAIERDFDCAGMCQESKFYAFSKVGRGPPGRNC